MRAGRAPVRARARGDLSQVQVGYLGIERQCHARGSHFQHATRISTASHLAGMNAPVMAGAYYRGAASAARQSLDGPSAPNQEAAGERSPAAGSAAVLGTVLGPAQASGRRGCSLAAYRPGPASGACRPPARAGARARPSARRAARSPASASAQQLKGGLGAAQRIVDCDGLRAT